MSPTEVLSQLLQINRGAAKFIYGGLGLFAAAAIVISFGSGQFNDLKIAALYILVLAIGVAILGAIGSNKLMKSVICWILVTAFGAWTLGLGLSVANVPRSMPSTACYLRLHLEPPEVCETRLRDPENDIRLGGLATATTASAASGLIWRVQQEESQPTPTPTNHRGNVFVQFVDPLPRPEIIAMAQALANLGWQVQGAQDGGELVKAGPETNEIRYFKEADRAAAIELATTLHALYPNGPIFVRDFTRLGAYVRAGTLEIWIATPLGPAIDS